MKTFQMVSSGTSLYGNLGIKGGSQIEKKYAQYLLYNIPNATKITFKGASFGSILAPKANVVNEFFSASKMSGNYLSGYFAGTLVCNSYAGGLQFGDCTYTGRLGELYDVDVAVITSESGEYIPNTLMEIVTYEGKLMKEWYSTDGITSIKLPDGDYIVRERNNNYSYIIPNQTYSVFSVRGNVFNGEAYSNVKLSVEIKYSNLQKTSVNIAGNKLPSTWSTLYSIAAIKSHSNNYKYVTSFEFDINTNITENIYAAIEMESKGIRNSSSYDSRFTTVNWTPKIKVENNHVILPIPIIENLYLSDTTAEGLTAQFYTADGTNVTDQVTISNIYANIYTSYNYGSQVYDESNGYVPSHISVDENGTIIVKNAHKDVRLSFLMKDASTGEEISGGILGLYNKNNELLQTVELEGSLAEFTNVDAIVVTVKEIKPPDGYIKTNQPYTLTLDSNLPNQLHLSTINVNHDRIKVPVENVNDRGAQLPGAELTVIDSNGNSVANIVSGNEIKYVEKLTPGTYTLTQTYTPPSYAKAKDIVFTVDENGKIFVDEQEVSKLTMVNTLVLGKIAITKTGEVFGSLTEKDKVGIYTNYKFNYIIGNLQNVVFHVYAAEDIYVGNTLYFAKDQNMYGGYVNVDGIFETQEIPPGKYYFVEMRTEDGYILSKTPITVTIVYNEDNNGHTVYATETIQSERIKANITAQKIETGTNKKIQGSIFGLYSSEEMYETIPADMLLSTAITNEEGIATFDIDVPLGVYYVKELQPSAGYVRSDEKQMVTFTAQDLNANINPDITSKSYPTVFESEYTKIQISKTEVNTGKPIIGATLKLYDLQNNPVVDINGKEYEWITDGTAKLIERIPAGKYILKEVIPAPGYVSAADMEITVEEISNLQEFNMQADFTKIKINRVELENMKSNQDTQEQLLGVKLQIFDLQNNSVIDSNGNPYVWVTDINAKYIEKLPIGTYILKEIETPAGYITPQDIQFTVEDTSEIQKFVIEGDYTKVEILNIDAETKTPITGSILQIFDENDNAVTDSSGQVYKWLTTSNAKVIKKLPVGKYKLVEIQCFDGYIKSENIEFEVKNSIEPLKLVMENKFTKLEIENLDENGKAISGMSLQILDEYSNIVEEWNTEENSYKIFKKLKAGKNYTLTQNRVVDGYFKAEDIKFLVAENGDIVVDNQVVEKITIVNKFAIGTIKVTKTGEVVSGVSKLENGEVIYEQFNDYKFDYEETTLSGVVFELFAAEDILLNGTIKYVKDQKIDEAITDKSGVAIFENVNLGSYYFTEKITLDGYELDKKPVTLVVGYKGENMPIIYTTTFENNRIHAQVTVKAFEKSLITDEVQNPPLKGVVFGLYTKEEMYGLPANTLLSTIKTRDDGTAVFDIDIPTGKYYVKELKTVDGYVLSNEIKEFNFDVSNVTAEFSFEKDYTKVKIKKINEKDEYVQNIKLQIQDKNGNILEEWTTTDIYYRIDKKLKVGETYKLIEVETLSEYEKNAPIEFTVNTDGTINILKIMTVKKSKAENKPENDNENQNSSNNNSTNEDSTQNDVIDEEKTENQENMNGVQTGDNVGIVMIILIITALIFFIYNCCFVWVKKE